MTAADFPIDDDWLEFDPNPSKPSFALPPGAVDAHCHVFGPGARFPYAATRKYTPCDAPKETLWALRDHLGFSRNVIVQATCHGLDNRALMDALEDSNGLARGVATVSNDMSDELLQALHDAGVRGARFNFVRRLVDVLPRDELLAIGERIQSLGWHLVIYIESQDLANLRSFLEGLPGTIVFDHMGRPDASRDIDGDAFKQQFEVAVVDKARFVFSYLWPRIDASPAELERGAGIWNRNSYNKDIKAATWLVARTAHALDAIS